MIPKEFDIDELRNAMSQGGQSDLRFACEFVDRIANAVQKFKHEETLKDGSKFFRARNDYTEDEVLETGQINLWPLDRQDIRAPPKEKTGLGRFNSPVIWKYGRGSCISGNQGFANRSLHYSPIRDHSSA